MQIPVRLGDRAYAIEIADSYYRLPARLAAVTSSTHGWVISHPFLIKRHGRELMAPLQRAGWTLGTITVPESERSKSVAVALRVLTTLSRNTRMHVPTLFAFGGGVIGDLTGFVAAVFRRGVPYVQVPTTLLAQVDSAIGGKVGVDLPHGKNLVGAFYQPRLVWNNLTVLRTLPLRQRRSGLAEVIKSGVIADAALFRFVEEHLQACLAGEPRALRVIIERSCRIKARVVEQDEREAGDVRAQLNFGHTLGHALEAATQYRRWSHGEAIAIGMGAAAQLAVDLDVMPTVACRRLTHLLEAAGLPTVATGVSRTAVLRALPFDKKFIRGRPRWVLPQRIGRVLVTEDVPPAAVQRIVAQYVQ